MVLLPDTSSSFHEDVYIFPFGLSLSKACQRGYCGSASSPRTVMVLAKRTSSYLCQTHRSASPQPTATKFSNICATGKTASRRIPFALATNAPYTLSPFSSKRKMPRGVSSPPSPGAHSPLSLRERAGERGSSELLEPPSTQPRGFLAPKTKPTLS